MGINSSIKHSLTHSVLKGNMLVTNIQHSLTNAPVCLLMIKCNQSIDDYILKVRVLIQFFTFYPYNPISTNQ